MSPSARAARLKLGLVIKQDRLPLDQWVAYQGALNNLLIIVENDTHDESYFEGYEAGKKTTLRECYTRVDHYE